MTLESLAAGKEAETRASFARQSLMTALGASIVELGAGRCVLEAPFSAMAGQQQGFFHGGVVGALGDTAGGYAAMTRLPIGVDVLTLEYKINFLKPAAGQKLIAEGVVLRAEAKDGARIFFHCRKRCRTSCIVSTPAAPISSTGIPIS